jgi:acyl-CoA synthetase (AMP-forming)/AMP-acid ligase II
MFLAELELISKGPCTPGEFKYLRTGVIGGSPIPASLRVALHERLNLLNLTNCYGLTESSPIICQTVSTDTLEQKLNTVGRMLPHTSARIVARDDPTRTLRRGEKGELLISGYGVMQGYWKDEKRTSEALVMEEKEDGSKLNWLRSGDEALFKPDGYIQITGRIKDIIIRGGENIYPPEIENVLIQHPMVSNASVVGLPDPNYGEAVAAFVIVREGVHAIEDEENNGCQESKGMPVSKENIRNWVLDRLPKMLVPKFVFWVDRMPLTASGKIEKYKLQELGIQLLKDVHIDGI